MGNRAVRFSLLILLVAVTATGALFLQDIERRADDLVVVRNDVDARLAVLSEVLAGIGAAQQSYVAPGQTDEPWFQRMSGLVRQLYDETAALRPLLRSAAATEALQALADGTDALIGADTRARENLLLGLELMAADVIFSDSRDTLGSMSGRVRDLGAAERAAHATVFAALTQERWIVLGAMAAVWLMGFFALVPLPAQAAAPSLTILEPIHQASPESHRAKPPSVDLLEAAALCTGLSRLTTTEALPDLLSRVAGVLDASGIILWVAAGEELFAVTAHGYRPQMIAKLGPIPRNADNATAKAWRSGEVTTVQAAENSSGAIVAPMFGPDTCVGVVAMEVRHGREGDPSARAVAAIIAAQLATVVSAWADASPAKVTGEVTPQLVREFRSAGI